MTYLFEFFLQKKLMLLLVETILIKYIKVTVFTISIISCSTEVFKVLVITISNSSLEIFSLLRSIKQHSLGDSVANKRRIFFDFFLVSINVLSIFSKHFLIQRINCCLSIMKNSNHSQVNNHIFVSLSGVRIQSAVGRLIKKRNAFRKRNPGENFWTQ